MHNLHQLSAEQSTNLTAITNYDKKSKQHHLFLIQYI